MSNILQYKVLRNLTPTPQIQSLNVIQIEKPDTYIKNLLNNDVY